MIGYFPTPHPDEVLYSVCARYSDLMQFPNSGTAARRFFGRRGVSAAVDLPSGLDHLIRVLPQGHCYTVSSFIKNNTLEPFYAAFLPLDRLDAIQDDMRESGNNHIYTRLGINVRELKQPDYLRFCPLCIRADRKQFGETYWHRVHQILGIDVCPDHKVFLEMSGVQWQQRSNSGKVTSAEKAVTGLPHRALSLANSGNAILLKIARDAAWLLTRSEQPLGNKMIRQRYYNLLLERGYAYYNGRIRTTKLIKAFLEFYSPQFLTDIQCQIIGRDKCWLTRLVNPHKAVTVQPPLHHLLLITFLGVTAKSFFTSFHEFKPFGDGPWPCLNRATKHFGKPLIKECHITDNIIKKKTGRPLGIFGCKCGFIYNRVGPDNSGDDRLRIDSVQTYGQAWENLLRKYWSNLDITVQVIADRLGVSHLTITRHAIRLKLPMNTPCSRVVSKNLIRRFKNYRRTRPETLQAYRSEWITVRKENPGARRQQLIDAANFLYLWLRKNDSDWLEVNLPASCKIIQRGDRTDWKAQDHLLSTLIKKVADSIKERPGRPTRASLSEIIRNIGHRGWIENYRDKLPRTAKAIESSVESAEDFSIRRVKWSKGYYLQKGIFPSRHQFIIVAGLRTQAGTKPKVQIAIDSALEELRKAFRCNPRMDSLSMT
jgi:hypothetical protein